MFINKEFFQNLQNKLGAINSAIAIDIGTQFMKIALVKPGVPMEIVLNKESKRKTPFALAIRNGERFFGESAMQMVPLFC